MAVFLGSGLWVPELKSVVTIELCRSEAWLWPSLAYTPVEKELTMSNASKKNKWWYHLETGPCSHQQAWRWARGLSCACAPLKCKTDGADASHDQWQCGVNGLDVNSGWKDLASRASFSMPVVCSSRKTASGFSFITGQSKINNSRLCGLQGALRKASLPGEHWRAPWLPSFSTLRPTPPKKQRLKGAYGKETTTVMKRPSWRHKMVAHY